MNLKTSVSAIILTVFAGLALLQIQWIRTQASAYLLTSPLTSPITSPATPAPTASPTPDPITSPATPAPTSEPTATPTPEPTATPSPEPTETPAPSSNNSSGNHDSGNSNSSGQSICNDSAPTSAPRITLTTAKANGEVYLRWTKVEGPVSHYMLSYGLKPGIDQYGSPNIGNTQEFTVKGLSKNSVYYFRVRAVNNCTPGQPSNEAMVKVGNPRVSYYSSTVLGGKINSSKVTPVSVKNAPIVVPAANTSSQNPINSIFHKVFGFFIH